MTTRLLYLVSHPIQYQAPLLRHLAAQPDLSLRVVFGRDTSDGYFDSGFGRDIRWDVPLRQGYDSVLVEQTSIEREITQCDVVWMHGWQDSWMRQALRLARRLNRPVLMRGENTLAAMPDGLPPRSWLKRLYLGWLFRHVSAFLAIGSDNRAYYQEHAIAPERIFSMPYAVDNARFADQAARADLAGLRRDLGLSDACPVILYAGKLMRRKHPHTLLEAWKKAAWPTGRRPALLFVGAGEMEAELKRERHPGIHFAGFRNQAELPAFYALADIFVLASEAEPWGLAVNEAMASGTAVIVGEQVGCAADLVAAPWGATVRPGDADSLAAALLNLLPHAATAGKAAAQHIARWDFDADLDGLRQALHWLETRS